MITFPTISRLPILSEWVLRVMRVLIQNLNVNINISVDLSFPIVALILTASYSFMPTNSAECVFIAE